LNIQPFRRRQFLQPLLCLTHRLSRGGVEVGKLQMVKGYLLVVCDTRG
jgi:hypothetical protein